MVKSIESIPDIHLELFNQSYKLSGNLEVLLNGERTIVGILALTICMRSALIQDKDLNVDQVCNLLKSLVKRNEEEKENAN